METLEPPHQVRDTDCMGLPKYFWRQFLHCSDGQVVIGIGSTPEQSAAEAISNRQKHEEFLRLQPTEQLKMLLARDQLLSNDMERAIRLIAQLVLNEKEM